MVDVRASNEKLRARSRRIVALATGAGRRRDRGGARRDGRRGEERHPRHPRRGRRPDRRPPAGRQPTAICAPRSGLGHDRAVRSPHSRSPQSRRSTPGTTHSKAPRPWPTHKNRATAAAILPLVGGAANVTSVAHCMTRLRLGLRRPRARRRGRAEGAARRHGRGRRRHVPDRARPGNGRPGHPGVRGPGRGGEGRRTRRRTRRRPRPHAVTADELAAQGAELRAARKAKNATPVQAVPAPDRQHLRPADPGADRLRHHRRHQRPADQPAAGCRGVTPALAAIASGFMALIAVFVGHNTAKEFGGTPILGGAVAAVIVYAGRREHRPPSARSSSPGQGGVLGALGAALLATYVEKWCRKSGPGGAGRPGHAHPHGPGLRPGHALRPDVRGGRDLHGHRHRRQLAARQHAAPSPGLVLGGLFLPLVMLGLHQALIPIHTTLIEQQGYTVLLPVLAMAGAGQVGCRDRRLHAAPAQQVDPQDDQVRAPRGLPGRRRTPDLRRLAPARPPLHHGVRGRRGGRRVRRLLLDARRQGRLHGDRPFGLGPVPPPRRQQGPRHDGRDLRARACWSATSWASWRRTSSASASRCWWI